METKIVVPGFYAEIQDYNLLALTETKSLVKDPIVLLADLPDFVYIPDENSSDVNAVRRVRISPNTVLPVTSVTEIIKVLSGENIIDGILTQVQKDELVCKDIINILKMNKDSAEAGQIAVVKIVKRDGTRPDMNNKFEVYQALENAYEKLGNIKASQIVPVGISAEEDFVTTTEAIADLKIERVSTAGSYSKLAETVFNNTYMFNPAEEYSDVKVEFKMSQPVATFDACEAGGTPTAEATKIIDFGLDSEEVKELLTGTVLVEGVEVMTDVKLELDSEKKLFVTSEEVVVEIAPGEVEIVLSKGHVFATVKTKQHATTNKLVVAPAANGPALNHYADAGTIQATKKMKTAAASEVVVLAGGNQTIKLDVVINSMPWTDIKNKGNIKEVVKNVKVKIGQEDGVANYAPTKSGSLVIEFKNSVLKKETAIIVNGIEAMKAPVDLNESLELVLVDTVVVETAVGLKVIIEKGTLVTKPTTAKETNIYFDAKSDEVTTPVYVINYVPEGAEPVMKSLEYAQELTKNLSETLVVWGVKPPESSDPDELIKYATELTMLPKFQRGFKKRLSASKEIDLGMFLTVVVGSQKVNSIGGISNFSQVRVIDFERTDGGVGEVKRYTDKLFVELTTDYKTGMNVELKTYVGVKTVTEKVKVLSTKEVMGKTMITLDTIIDTSVFSLDGFDIMLSNTDTKDRFGSYTASVFAVKALGEKDRAPVAQELAGTCDVNFPGEAQRILLEAKFTVINVDTVTGNGIIVDCPLMTRGDSDFKERSQIGCVLYFLKRLREVANSKKGKRFPQKEQKVLFEDEMRDIFKNELALADTIISNFEFVADMSRLDSKGFLAVKFKVVDTKKFKTAEFSGGLAKI